MNESDVAYPPMPAGLERFARPVSVVPHETFAARMAESALLSARGAWEASGLPAIDPGITELVQALGIVRE